MLSFNFFVISLLAHSLHLSFLLLINFVVIRYVSTSNWIEHNLFANQLVHSINRWSKKTLNLTYSIKFYQFSLRFIFFLLIVSFLIKVLLLKPLAPFGTNNNNNNREPVLAGDEKKNTRTKNSSKGIRRREGKRRWSEWER